MGEFNKSDHRKTKICNRNNGCIPKLQYITNTDIWQIVRGQGHTVSTATTKF